MTRTNTRETGGALPEALLFIHGFQDCGATWSRLLDVLASTEANLIAPDLAGAGTRRLEESPFTLDRAVADVLARIDSEGFRSVGLVGHSMGAQIAELVAIKIPKRVTGLVLITPTPLGGNALPDEVRAMLRECGGDAAAQRAIRTMFSRSMAAEDLDRSVMPDRLMGKEAIRGYYDAFTVGDPRGTEPCGYQGLTLMIGSQGDPVIPLKMVEDIRRDRFPDAQLRVIEGAGHWPHAEQPVKTAKAVLSLFH